MGILTMMMLYAAVQSSITKRRYSNVSKKKKKNIIVSFEADEQKTYVDLLDDWRRKLSRWYGMIDQCRVCPRVHGRQVDDLRFPFQGAWMEAIVYF
jgi:hypothetical protein